MTARTRPRRRHAAWRRHALPLTAVAAVVVIGAARAAAGVPPTHDFLLNCAGCHRFDGSGSERVPSLYDVGRIVSMPGGREYLARVPGVAQAPIDDERLAALLNWLLRRFGDTVAAPTYGAAEVGRLRRRPFTDPGAARTALFESARTAPFESARPAP